MSKETNVLNKNVSNRDFNPVGLINASFDLQAQTTVNFSCVNVSVFLISIIAINMKIIYDVYDIK